MVAGDAQVHPDQSSIGRDRPSIVFAMHGLLLARPPDTDFRPAAGSGAMIDGHGPTRGERRPEVPGAGSHSCAASGLGLTRADPLPSSGTSVTGPAVAIRRTRPRTHHGHDPQSRTRRHPPNQPGYSCNPRPPARSTPEVPYMSRRTRSSSRVSP